MNQIQLKAALVLAAGNGSIQDCKRLLDLGADVNGATDSGMTPLHKSAGAGHVGVSQLMLDHGAHLYARTDHGATPLMWTATVGNLEGASFLLERGADIQDRSDNGWTVMHYAAEGGHDRLIKMFIVRGGNIHWRSDAGQLPIHVAMRNLNTVALLVSLGSDLAGIKAHQRQIRNLLGMPKLRAAAWGGHVDVAVRLAQSGSDIDAVFENKTAIDVAIGRGHVETAQALRAMVAYREAQKSAQEILQEMRIEP